MTRIVFAIPGDLAAPTGGYKYDRRVIEALPAFGVEVVHCPLPGGFPHPGENELALAVEAINRAASSGGVALIDGLAYGAMTEAAIEAIRAPIIALCHHPLSLETGLTPARAKALRASESKALAQAAHVIVTSAHTAALLSRDFGVAAEKISIAPPGTDRVPRAEGSNGTLTLLAVGAIIPRKGFDILIDALAPLRASQWRLVIAGGRTYAPQCFAALMRLVGAHGLQGRVEFLGELDDATFGAVYDKSDIFVSSSLYEGYGMALAEALAHGLPIVTTTGGAAADTAPRDGALKVAPGDVAALREALREIIQDAALRARLAEASWRAGENLPRWSDAARIIARAAQNIARPAS